MKAISVIFVQEGCIMKSGIYTVSDGAHIYHETALTFTMKEKERDAPLF